MKQEDDNCLDVQENWNCQNAISIPSLTTRVVGSFDFAKPLDSYIPGTCRLYIEENVLWYTLGPFDEDSCVTVRNLCVKRLRTETTLTAPLFL